MPEGNAVQVLAQLCQLLGVEELASDANFFEVGGDSLVAVEWMERTEGLLGIEFPFEVLFSEGDISATVGECARRAGQSAMKA